MATLYFIFLFIYFGQDVLCWPSSAHGMGTDNGASSRKAV